MDFTKYEATAAKCAEKSEYFARLDFNNIAGAFYEAVTAMKEMVELLKKLAETAPAEEATDGEN